jgi:tRNA(adenine34) deaminase
VDGSRQEEQEEKGRRKQNRGHRPAAVQCLCATHDMDESSKNSVLNADQDERFMRAALREAAAAEEAGDVPIGAVIVKDGQLIGKAHNQRELLQDPTAHAEMIALTQAAEKVGSWRLEGCTIYVTLEPCPMCAGALVMGRVVRLVYGCDDPKAGACGTLYDIVRDARLNHRLEVRKGVLAEECSSILTTFFRKKRNSDGNSY